MIFLGKMFPFLVKTFESYQPWLLERICLVLTYSFTAQCYPRWCFATTEEYYCLVLIFAALFDVHLWRYVCFVVDAVTAWRIAPTRMMKWWIRSYVTIVGKQVILWLTAPIRYKMVFCLWPYLIVSLFFIPWTMYFLLLLFFLGVHTFLQVSNFLSFSLWCQYWSTIVHVFFVST